MALKVQQKRQGSSFRDTLFKVFLLESSEPFPAFEHVVAAHRSQAMQGGGYQGARGPSIRASNRAFYADFVSRKIRAETWKSCSCSC